MREFNLIGFLGCSNTTMAVQGYRTLGYQDSIWRSLNYNGGTVDVWAADVNASPQEYWDLFKQGLVDNPETDVIWWQLCSLQGTSEAALSGYALTVLSEIRRLAPNCKILLSALNDYIPPHECRKVGAPEEEIIRAVVSSLVSEGLVDGPGPIMPPLASIYQTPSNPPRDETLSDGCHPNTVGKEKFGYALADFFGGSPQLRRRRH